MKKTVLIVLTALVAVQALPQERRYQRSMNKALHAMQEATGPEALINSAGGFEGIAASFGDKWLPFYYAAQTLTLASLELEDGPTCDTLLKRAQVSLQRAADLASGESEVHALLALHLLARMKVDPESRGPELFEDFFYTLEMARKLNPNNPRVYYLEGLMTANMPEMMGGGPEAARPIHEMAARKFRSFRSEDPLWPGWGEDLNREQLENLQ